MFQKKTVAKPFYCDVTEYNYKGGISKCSLVLYIFINQGPSNPSTIYTALDFAWPVTFDQPLYIKAAEIVASLSDLTNVCVRLGGFHIRMSYMGFIGFVMAGNELESLWETVYAFNTVVHIYTVYLR